MQQLLALSNRITRLIERIGRMAALLALPLMFVIVYDIISRKLLSIYPALSDSIWHVSSTKLQEMEWHLHAVLFLLCLGFAYLRDRHVRIELIRARFSPLLRATIELAGCLLFLLPYCYLVISFGIDFAARAFHSGEVSAALTGLSHRWLIKAMLPLGFSILALAAIATICRNIVMLFGPAHLRKQAEPHP